MPQFDAFSPVYQQFALLSGAWYATLFDYANQLFLMLALIEIALGAILWMTAQQSHDHLGMMMFRKILWIGFMYAILLNSQTWIPAVINSFITAGATASGVPALNPGEIFTQGLGLSCSILALFADMARLFKPVSLVVGIFSAFVLFFAYCAISFQVALTLMLTYLVTGGGVFLLGFGAFHGTVNITEKYLSLVIAVGIKLFVIYLMVGAGAQLAAQWQGLINNGDLFGTVATPMAIAGSALLYGTACWMLPSLASSMISGAVGFGLMEAIGTIRMAAGMGAAAMAAPAAMASGAWAAGGIAKQTMANAAGTAPSVGGAALSAIKGLAAGAGAIGREARNAAVPRLARAVHNLQEQRNNT